jgi:hypothetical protein
MHQESGFHQRAFFNAATITVSIAVLMASFIAGNSGVGGFP